MKIAIIGLPKSGKTTIFNALTQGEAEVSPYSSSLKSNIGIAKVPDSRLSVLANISRPRKTTAAEVNYVDIAGSLKNINEQEEIKGELQNYLSTADALIEVVRSFEDENLPHPQGKIDFKRDVATMYLEMALSDLAIIERKLQKLDKNLKGARASERNLYIKEQALLQKIKSNLESENPIWQQDLNAEEIKALSNYQFLTAKPMLLVLNIGEEQIEQASDMANELKALYPQFAVIAICGKLEMELAQLSEPEAGEFRRSMGLTSPALNKVIELSYHLLGLISFFTTGSDETKAWTISRGIIAPKAAGKIHSDIERGFIRAEVISFPDLEQCGNLTEARKKGLLRMEGKDYIVQDGDVINFLFNI